MPIKKPGPHLGHAVGLKQVKKAMAHGKKGVYATLQLTPLIDMFVMMIVFLLMTFSASGELTMVQKDIKLPDASQFTALERAPVISVSSPDSDPSGGVITLDGREVATVRELVDSDNPDWKIPRLTEDLEILRNNCKLVHPDNADTACGAVIVNSDKKVAFKALKKVMYSAGLAGYSNVNFAVNSAGGGAGAGG